MTAFADCQVRVSDEAPSTLFFAAQMADMGAFVQLRGTRLSLEGLNRALAMCTRHPRAARVSVSRGGTNLHITFCSPATSKVVPESLWADTAAWALGGLASLTGEPDGPALAPGTPLASYCAALYGMLAAAAALRTRDLRCEIELDLASVVSTLIEVAGLRFAVDGELRGRLGDWSGLAGWGLYDCNDGAVAIALRDKVQLNALSRFLRIDDVVVPGFSDFIWGHCELMDELNAYLVGALAEVPVHELTEMCRTERIACAPVQAFPELLQDRHLNQRGVFGDIDGLRVPRLPIQHHTSSQSEPRLLNGTIALPLHGLRVIDLSSVWAGPMAARLLADLGATVVKVGSLNKRVGSYAGDSETWDRDFYAILSDHNKLATEADLSLLDERERLLVLVRSADVLVENFTPGSLARLNLSHETLLAENPRLSIIAMPAMGLSGPDSAAVGYGATIEQAAGIGWLYRDANGRPHRSGINFSDPVAGLWGAIAGAVGAPGVVELSQQEAALSLLRPALRRYQLEGTLPSAVESIWDKAKNRWMFQADSSGELAATPVLNAAEVVGSPSGPGRGGNRWVQHPNGVSFPLPVLPWMGALGSGTAIEPVQMPVPLAAINPIKWQLESSE